MQYEGQFTLWQFPQWHFCNEAILRPANGYLLFVGVEAVEVDYNRPLAMYAAGETTGVVPASVTILGGAEYTFALKAVSQGGIVSSSAASITVTTNAANDGLALPAPAAIDPALAIIKPTAAGTFNIRLAGYENNSIVNASNVEVCNNDTINWSSPLAIGSVNRCLRTGLDITTNYADASDQSFAVRTVSAAGGVSQVTVIGPAAADAAAPAVPAISSITLKGLNS